jgi:gas vesicle structural protein
MTVARQGAGSNYLQRSPGPSGLAEVLDLILDKGLVIDVFVRVALVGIELITIDARIVIASVDTYLRFAEAVNRLDLQAQGPDSLRDLVSGGSENGNESGKTRGAIEGAKEKASEATERVREKVRG